MRRDKKNRNPPTPGSREANVPEDVLKAAYKRTTDEGGFISENLMFERPDSEPAAPELPTRFP